jgi:MSHA biogenesis protein MshE
VLLVGEMRDRETVEIGLRGAMTGHLVFSTLHTINALATVNRLLDMGAAGYMIAAALHGVVAQRLVRRVCTDCAAPATPSANELAWLAACRPALNPSQARFVAGAGCTYCNLTGYRGRIAVYELLEIDRPLADAIRRGDANEFADAARSRPSYTPLASSAIDLALAGVTSIAEAMAVGSGLEEFTDAEVAPAVPAATEALPEALADAQVGRLLGVQG